MDCRVGGGRLDNRAYKMTRLVEFPQSTISLGSILDVRLKIDLEELLNPAPALAFTEDLQYLNRTYQYPPWLHERKSNLDAYQ